MQERLTFAPLGRTGWVTVFFLPSKRVVWYARNAAEARVFMMEQAEEARAEPGQADLFGEVA